MKKLLAWVLTLAMLLSVVPTAVFAQDSITDPVVFTKTLIQATDTQPAKIRLEAYTTGSNITSEAKLPTDIVLVLDQSGSMDDPMNNQTKLAVMKSAAKQFVADVAEMNNEAGDLYRVAVVGFASESGYNDNSEILTVTHSETVTSTYYQRVTGELDTSKTYYIRSGQDYRAIEYSDRYDGWYTTGWNASEVNVNRTTVYERIRETTEVESVGVAFNDLTSDHYSTALVNCTEPAIGNDGMIGKAIDALEGEGATRTDLGLEMAAKIFDAQPEGTYDNRGKVVVLITDGVPTTFDTFSSSVANAAVAYAKQMKDDGAYVFSLYLGNPSSQSVNFLQACSSNYPDATSISKLGTKAAESYYAAHSDVATIEAMFKGIVNSITANSSLNERSVVTDTLSPYFKLAADLQTTGTRQIEVYTVDKTANGWADTEVPFEPAKVTIGGKDNRTISVTGFNFAAHCITEDPKGGDGSTDYGRKLVIYIPIVEDPEADTFGGWLPTNESAGIYQDASAEEPVITAESGYESVSIRYTINAAERAFHVEGTLLSDPVEFSVTFEELMNSENSVFDEMVNRLPDGLRNEGVTMTYKLYDIGTTDRESNDRNDDVLVAELTAHVAAGSDVDVTDYSKWTWHVDKAEMTIPANDYFAEKVYVVVCTLTSTAADDALTVYNYLDLSAVRGDLAHIIYGTIDEGGKTTVSAGAPGSLLGNTYTEAVTEGNDSAIMTFTPLKGYEIESIEYYTSAEAPFDTGYILYSRDPNAVITNVDLDGDGTADAAALQDDGSWSFRAHDVTGGVAVEVNTRQISYTLTTGSDEGSEIISGTTYTYHATETFNVPFQAISGYYLHELEVNGTIYDLTSESDRAALEDAYNAVFTMAKLLDADVVVGGSVEVPRTRDNHVEVSSATRSYYVTLKYYIQNSDGSYTEQTAMQEGPTAVAYGARIMDSEVPAYMPGDVKVFDESNYTMSDWYHTATDTEFYGLVLMEEALMPAEDLTLHAVWTRNPDVKIADLTVRKTIQGDPGSNASFEFVALYHENLAGKAEIQFAADDAVSTKDEFMPIILTDRQADSFKEGNGGIYIFEVENSGDTSHWHYDKALYAMKWDESLNEGQGGLVLSLNGQVVSDSVAAFVNERVTMSFTFDANGGAWEGAVEGYTMGEGNTTAATEGYFGDVVEKIAVEPVREGYEFIGWYTTEALTAQLWTQYNPTVNLYQDTVVYAKWEKIPEPPQPEKLKGTLYVNLQDENGIALADLVKISIEESYLIAQDDDAADYEYPASLEYNGKNYIYDGVASGELSGTLTKKDEIVVVCLQYTLDEFNDEKDEPTGGDEIPDYKQVQFLYAAGEHGSVAPVREIVTIDGSDYTDVTVSAELGSEATAEEGYALDKWTYEANSDANAEAALNQEGSKILPAVENADGGKTYTFKASFAEDKKGDEDDGGEDDIPDKYQVFVEFRSANEEQGTVTGKIRQTFTFEEESGNVTPSLDGVIVTAAEGYAFDYWTKDAQPQPLSSEQVETTIENVPGSTTIIFTANFAEDVLVDDEKD
ncbi:MAG: hypothetical protein E7464_04325, partial [Ruminococcaceae bacterium]|nr:hypothetical protein [Oscillospiraceae bacterium]